MVATTWVLAMALAVVCRVIVAGLTAVVGSDVAVATGSSSCGMRGWGVSWGRGGWPGSQGWHLQGVGGCFEAGGGGC